MQKNILSFLDQLDPQAKRIGAVNTIIKDNDGALIGKNSDAPGFISALKEAKLPYIDRDVLLLGAGGAAWAIADALSGLGKRCIHIYNRTTSKAQSLIEHLLKHYPEQSYSLCLTPQALRMPLLIVQATPVGTPQSALAQKMPPHPKLKTEDALIDLVYHPTPLLQKAQQQGVLAIDGQSMLLHQAAISFSWWFQTPPPIYEMRKALQQHLDFWNAS